MSKPAAHRRKPRKSAAAAALARPCPKEALDVLAYCQPEQRDVAGPPWVSVHPADLYPAVIDRIRHCLATDLKYPPELVDIDPQPGIDPWRAAGNYVAAARRLPPQAWDDALADLAELGTDPNRLADRRTALELARLWFTRALKNRVRPIGLHLTADPQFRL